MFFTGLKDLLLFLTLASKSRSLAALGMTPLNVFFNELLELCVPEVELGIEQNSGRAPASGASPSREIKSVGNRCNEENRVRHLLGCRESEPVWKLLEV